MPVDRQEFEKFKDEHVRSREVDEGIGRLRLSPFFAFLGPVALIIMKVTEHKPSRSLIYAVWATAPVAILFLIINYLRLPQEAMGSRPALSILLFTLAAVVATFVLTFYWSLMPAGSP